jgi:probable F420-dependent oxidoreductase
VKLWLPVIMEPVEQFVPLAQAAEAAGFEGVALADHVVVPEVFASVHPSGENPFTATSSFPDTFTMVTAMAMATTRLRLLSYVYVVPLRDPFTVAKQVGTTAIVSGYRTVLGVGAGWLEEEFDAIGRDPRTRGAWLDESIEVLRDAWDDGWVEHHGRLIDVPRSGVFPHPMGPVPIWVGGKSDAALRRAVRNDGWLGMNYALDEVEERLATLRRLREEAGDERDDFEVFVIANALPTDELYEQLEAWGVTSTMAGAWPPGDPAFGALEAKLDALEAAKERLARWLAPAPA